MALVTAPVNQRAYNSTKKVVSLGTWSWPGRGVYFFCCLVFFVVWVFRLFFSLLFRLVRVFLLLGGGVLFRPSDVFIFFCCVGGEG